MPRLFFKILLALHLFLFFKFAHFVYFHVQIFHTDQRIILTLPWQRFSFSFLRIQCRK